MVHVRSNALTTLILIAVALGIAGGSFWIRRSIIAEQEQRGRQEHGAKIAEQIQQIRQMQALNQLKQQQTAQLARLVDSLARNPSDTSLVLPMGSLMLQTGDTLGALAIYRRYVDSLNPSNVVALTDYAYVLYLTGDRKQGRALTLRAVQRAPRYQIALYNMAVMEYDERNIPAAISWMERCRSVDSSSPLGQLASRALNELRKMQSASSQ